MIYEIIEQCKKHYGIEYKFSEINDCDGCLSGSNRIFSSCSDCEIRKCGIEKKIKNCAYCTDYPCKNLSDLFKTDLEAKIRLDEIRNTL